MSQELEAAKAMLQEVQEDIAELQEQEEMLKEYIADLSAEESTNPYWTTPDELGARRLIPMMDIHDILLAGSREEQFYAKWYEPFYHEGYFASLTADISPEYLRMYTEAQTRHFAGAIVGLTFVLAKCYKEDGVLIEGYHIPWNGNHGPHSSTMTFQDMWTDPEKLNKCRAAAIRKMRWVDWEYRMAKMRGTLDAFMAKYPYYVPA